MGFLISVARWGWVGVLAYVAAVLFYSGEGWRKCLQMFQWVWA